MSRIQQTYSLLVLELTIFRNSIRNWTKFCCLTQISSDDILESLCIVSVFGSHRRGCCEFVKFRFFPGLSTSKSNCSVNTTYSVFFGRAPELGTTRPGSKVKTRSDASSFKHQFYGGYPPAAGWNSGFRVQGLGLVRFMGFMGFILFIGCTWWQFCGCCVKPRRPRRKGPILANPVLGILI